MKQPSKMMDLDNLSNQLKTSITGNQDFLFVVEPDLVQHFPIRDWDKEQVLAKAKELLASDTLDLSAWQNMLVITSETSSTILVVPKFQ